MLDLYQKKVALSWWEEGVLFVRRMGLWELVFFLILFVPVVLFILTVYILSAVGKTLGFRRKYIRFLLWIFEVRNNIKWMEEEEGLLV